MRNLSIIAILSVGCGKGGDTAAGGDFDFTQFEAGTFQFTTTAVDDDCYDQAFSVIFMPEGTANDWATTTELPAWGDLPSSYSIELQAPFSAMDVTVSAGGDGEMVLDGAEQIDVELDPDNYPGCLVDMDISASFDVVGASSIQGNAVLNTAGFDESGCPVVGGDPCAITLDLTAARL